MNYIILNKIYDNSKNNKDVTMDNQQETIIIFVS